MLWNDLKRTIHIILRIQMSWSCSVWKMVQTSSWTLCSYQNCLVEGKAGKVQRVIKSKDPITFSTSTVNFWWVCTITPHINTQTFKNIVCLYSWLGWRSDETTTGHFKGFTKKNVSYPYNVLFGPKNRSIPKWVTFTIMQYKTNTSTLSYWEVETFNW